MRKALSLFGWSKFQDCPRKDKWHNSLVESLASPKNGMDVGVFAKKKPLLLASFSSKVTWLDRVFSGSESKKIR